MSFRRWIRRFRVCNERSSRKTDSFAIFIDEDGFCVLKRRGFSGFPRRGDERMVRWDEIAEIMEGQEAGFPARRCISSTNTDLSRSSTRICGTGTLRFGNWSSIVPVLRKKPSCGLRSIRSIRSCCTPSNRARTRRKTSNESSCENSHKKRINVVL